MRGVLTLFPFVVLCLAPAIHPCLAEQEPSGQIVPADVAGRGEGTSATQADPAPPAPVRPIGTVARPKNGVRHPDLDEAWAQYDSVVAKVTEDVSAAINREYQSAVNKGDLDTAEKWEGVAKKFSSEGECQLEKELGAIGKKSVLKLKSAHTALEKAYDSVVKALTIEKKITQAKAAKSEFAGLASAVQETAKAREQATVFAKFVAVWRWPDGGTEEIRADGAWITRGDPNDRWSGKWVVDPQDPKGLCVVRTTNGGRKGPVTQRFYADPANPKVLRSEDGATITRE